MAPESFMGRVMEKYEERMTEETLYPDKRQWNNGGQMPLNPTKASDRHVCFYCMYGIVVPRISGREGYLPCM